MHATRFLLGLCVFCALVRIAFTQNRPGEDVLTQPTDLTRQSTAAANPYSLTFVLRNLKDLRVMYCDVSILKDRIERKVCAVDSLMLGQKALEITVETPRTLEDLMKELIPGAMRPAEPPPIITVIGSHYILRNLDYLRFEKGLQRMQDIIVRPGDIIVVGKISN